MAFLRAWALRIAGTALLAAAALALAPESGAKKILRAVCGMAAVIALLSGVRAFDSRSFAAYAAYYRQQADAAAEEAADAASAETRRIIEERCAAYILDKASELGLEARVSVRAVWSREGYWYPAGAEIAAAGPEQAKEELRQFIAAELGVSREEQIWCEHEG